MGKTKMKMGKSIPMLASLLPAIAAAPTTAAAHPPVSVVVTTDGHVYFSDLRRIWVLTPGGDFRVAVSGVHAHELWLRGDGAVCGDDVQNVGERYRFRYWCLGADGTLENDRDWQAGHPSDLGFSLTAPAGDGRYWAKGTGGTIRLIDEAGEADVEVSLGTDPAPSWVLAAPRPDAGSEAESPPHADALVVRGGALLRVSPTGHVATVADGLIERTEAFSFLRDRHALMKPWADRDGRIFLPIYAGQRVVRLTESGAPEVVVTSTGDWSPVGGTFLADGTLWLLEWSRSNAPRLRRISPNGDERTFGPPS